MNMRIYPTVEIECAGCERKDRYEFAGAPGLAVPEEDMVGGLRRQGWTIKGEGENRTAWCFTCTEPDRLRMVEEYKRRKGLCV